MSVIQSNSQSALGARSLNPSQELVGRSLNRLSSTTKAVGARDEPGAVSMTKRLDALNVRTSTAATNVQNALAYVQTADGYLNTMTGILSRLGELANLAQDSTADSSQISIYAQEFTALQDELRATIGGSTVEIGGAAVDAPKAIFNGMKLFAPRGGADAAEVEVEDAAGERIQITGTNLRAGGMLDLIRQDSAGTYLVSATDSNAVNVVSVATEALVTQRTALSATESRLNVVGTSLHVQAENISAAISGSGSADVALQATQLARYHILGASGNALLAQANHAPQSVLKLLQD
jgi:flagellin